MSAQITMTAAASLGVEAGDTIKVHGQLYKVVSITNHNTIKLRTARWYDRVWYNLKRAITWLNS